MNAEFRPCMHALNPYSTSVCWTLFFTKRAGLRSPCPTYSPHTRATFCDVPPPPPPPLHHPVRTFPPLPGGIFPPLPPPPPPGTAMLLFALAVSLCACFPPYQAGILALSFGLCKRCFLTLFGVILVPELMPSYAVWIAPCFLARFLAVCCVICCFLCSACFTQYNAGIYALLFVLWEPCFLSFLATFRPLKSRPAMQSGSCLAFATRSASLLLHLLFFGALRVFPLQCWHVSPPFRPLEGLLFKPFWRHFGL